MLHAHELSRATRFDAFRESVNSVFYPARIEPCSRGGLLQRRTLRAVSLKYLTVGFVRFGTETRIDPGPLGSYHVNVPLAGCVESECGPRQVLARPGTATVFTPREHTRLPRWGPDADVLCVKIERRSLESELEGLLGRPVDSCVRFDLAFDVTGATGSSWLSALRLLLDELDSEQSLTRRSAAHCEQLERLIISTLLRAQPHDHHEALFEAAPPARSRIVKRVLDALEAAPEQPWTLGDMARVAGVGARRLQQGFAEQTGMSPITYLRTLRLERARFDLGDGAESVGAVAHRWGFTHLGRFAEAYRTRFGETPSQTLRHGGR